MKTKVVFVDEVSQEVCAIVETEDVQEAIKQFEKEWDVKCWIDSAERDEVIVFFSKWA